MKILIADRSFEIRERLKNLVKDIYDNPEIFETESTLEAMSLVSIHRPNLVITDIDLHNGSGLSLLPILRSLTPQTLKIVFTNHIRYDLEQISIKLGADHFLSKGHDFVKIKKILSSLNHNNIKPN